MSMLWSILVASIPERYHSAHPLLFSLLETQAVARLADVELLMLLDNKRRPVGAKRNDLLAAARGEYVSFIDDDDMVAPDYVSRIRNAIQRNRTAPPDVICFPQRATLHPHGITHECRYSLQYWRDRPAENRRQLEPALGPDGKPLPTVLKWTGPPAHTQVWRRSVVADIRFPEQQFGEDVAWVDTACERAKTELQIECAEPLYLYRFSEDWTTTRS